MIKKNKKSQMLLVSLLIFAVTTSLGIGFLSMSRTNFRIVDNQVEDIIGYYLIQSGVQRVKERFQADFANYGIVAGRPVDEVINFSGSRSITITPTVIIGSNQRNASISASSGRANDTILRQYREVITTENIAWLVDRFDNKAIKVDSFGNQLAEVNGLSLPTCLDINPNTGDVWVGGANRIYKIDKDGNILKTIFTPPVRGIVVNPGNGDVWFTTAGTEVFWLDPEGVEIQRFPGFLNAGGIAINEFNNDDVWIADRGNNQVVRLRWQPGPTPYVEERYSDFLGQPFSSPAHIAIDQTGGRVFITSWEVINDPLYIYDRLGNPIALENVCQRIRSIDFDPQTDYVWLACWISPVMRVDSNDFSNRISVPGLFNPTSVSHDSQTGGCWISDTSNDRLIRVDINGVQLLEFDGLNYSEAVVSASSNINKIVELQ